MRTSWGAQATKVYRLHITCQAGHTTYLDYATMQSAKRALARGDDGGWYPTHIEIIREA